MSDRLQLKSGEVEVGVAVPVIDAVRAMLAAGQEELLGHLVSWTQGEAIPEASKIQLMGRPVFVDRAKKPWPYLKLILGHVLVRVNGKIRLVDLEAAENREMIQAYRAEEDARLRIDLGLTGTPGGK